MDRIKILLEIMESISEFFKKYISKKIYFKIIMKRKVFILRDFFFYIYTFYISRIYRVLPQWLKFFMRDTNTSRVQKVKSIAMDCRERFAGYTKDMKGRTRTVWENMFRILGTVIMLGQCPGQYWWTFCVHFGSCWVSPKHSRYFQEH